MLATLKPSPSTLPHRLAHAALALIAALSLALVAGARAQAAPTVDGEFDVPGGPGHITQGPDGSVWVVLDGTGPGGEDVARIAPNGDVEAFDVPLLANGVDIAAGPGDTLWVTRPAKVSRFSPGDPAGAEEFDIAGLGSPGEITLGPDGNMWAVPQGGDTLMRIPPGNPEGYTPFTILGMTARGIASDGVRLWIASFGNGAIYSATTAGEATPHPVGGGPQGIAAGPGGQIAYSNPADEVGRLTLGGSPLTTSTPAADPFGVALGADQAYWFAQFASDDLGRLTPDGQYTVLEGLSADSGPRRLTAGPGNTLWVSLETAKKVARVSGLEPPVTPVPPLPIGPGEMPPILSKLAVTPKRFRVAKAPTAVSAAKRGKARRGKGKRKRVPAGTRIKFTLNYRATVKLTFERKLAGRRRGGKCVKPTRALRSAKRCARYVRRGTLTRRIPRGGATSVPFSGRIGRKALAAGSYRVTAVAAGSDGRSSVPQRAAFTVVAR